jgi:hypothetical protein
MVGRAVRRAVDELNRGEQPTVTHLPEQKEGFPKVLCLDANHWIGLAQARNGLPRGSRYRAPLRAIEEAISGGKLVAPICVANALEAAKPGNADQRERLARFMVDLSRNHALINNLDLKKAEIEIALRRLYLGDSHTSGLRSRLLLRGMTAAATGTLFEIHTGNPTMDAIVNRSMLDPEVSTAELAHALPRETVEAFRQADTKSAATFAAIRKLDSHLSMDDRRLLGMRILLEEGSNFDEIVQATLKVHDINSASFRDWLSDPANVAKFTDAIPGLDVSTTLMLRRDRNCDALPRPTDVEDLFFLEVAIPYANIVLAEHLWTNIANQTALPGRYGTVILGNPEELPGALAAAGCTTA